MTIPEREGETTVDLRPPDEDQKRSDNERCQAAATADCEHVYATRIRGGEPICVPGCMLCGELGWDDIREQAEKIRAEAYRAGREDAAREARPMLNAVYSALDHASQLCRFHGAQYAAAGFQFGLPRCESCRQPWRVARALDLVNQAREVDQPRTPSGCDGEDSPEERTDG